MNLIEILNTKVPVDWTSKGHQYSGSFSLDAHEYVIQLDEFETINKLTLVDLGFTTDGKIDIVGSEKNASSVIGAVLNGALPKLKELNPDTVLVSVQKDSGSVENRLTLYSTLIKWVGKQINGYNYVPEWIENSNGFYKLISSISFLNQRSSCSLTQ